MPSRSSALLICAFCALLPVVLVLSTASLPILMVPAALLALWTARRDKLAFALPRGPLAWLGLLLLLWAVSASLWSIDVEEALLLALRLGVLGLAGGLLIGIASQLRPDERALVARWLCIGFACGLALILFERLSGNFLHNLVPEEHGVRQGISGLNRGATGIALLVWPVTAALYRGAAGRLALLLPPLVFGLLLFYDSQSAIVCVAAGLAVLLLARLSAEASMLLAAALLLVTMLAVPLVVEQLPAAKSIEGEWLAYSAKHRLHVWQFTAERIFDKPLFGWGFDSSSKVPSLGYELFEADWDIIPSHPHNVALQIWLELGLVGVLLALALLLSVWRLLGRLVGFDQASAVALLVASLVVASVSYGIWQSKWLATLIALALVVVASRGGEAEGARPVPRETGPP